MLVCSQGVEYRPGVQGKMLDRHKFSAGFLVSVGWVCYTAIMDPQVKLLLEEIVELIETSERLTPEHVASITATLKSILTIFTAPDGEEERSPGWLSKFLP